MDQLEYNVVKEGYLYVKHPPGTPARKMGKVWQRKFVVASKLKRENSPVTLHLHASNTVECSPCRSYHHLTLGQDCVLFRSHSRKYRKRAFGIASVEGTILNVLIYAAAETEKQAELWMMVLRDAIFPPSPLVQIEGVWQERHYVSLIDNERMLRSGLFGVYGHMLVTSNLVIVHPPTGKTVAGWSWQDVKGFQVARRDPGSDTSGVFYLSIRVTFRNPHETQELCFYSPTATIAVEYFNEYLHSGPKIHLQYRNSFHAQELQFLQCSEPKNNGVDSTESRTQNLDAVDCIMNSPKCVLGPNLIRFASSPSSVLNTSISSRMSADGVICGHSSDESEYTPSVTPVLSRKYQDLQTESSIEDLVSYVNTSSVFPGLSMYDEKTWVETPVYYENISRHSTTRNVSTANHRDWHTTVMKDNILINSANPADFSSASNIAYSNLRQLQFEAESFNQENVYCEIPTYAFCRTTSIGGETVYEEFGDEDDGDVELDDVYVPPLPPPRKARRPTALQLEALSSSIESTLTNLQTDKPKTWFSTIKGMKKILTKDRKAKSANPSPTSESKPPVSEVLHSNMKRNESDPAFVTTYGSGLTDSSVLQLELPVPFLPLNLIDLEAGDNGSVTSSNIKSNGRIPGTQSLDDLQLGLRPKHSCLKHFLESLNEPGIRPYPCNCCSMPRVNSEFSMICDPFRRRQSKSLSADIERHLQSLRTGFEKCPKRESVSRQASGEYCPMAPILNLESIKTSTRSHSDVSEVCN